ncbi:hypothetical protein A2U01_0062428, partial [Trifolium medium]|nr:hypothetical protein [Trifolium medium]
MAAKLLVLLIEASHRSGPIDCDEILEHEDFADRGFDANSLRLKREEIVAWRKKMAVDWTNALPLKVD